MNKSSTVANNRKEYENTKINTDQMKSWWFELEDMAAHVCDNLCHYRREARAQEDLEENCELCQVNVCMKRLQELVK